MKAVRAALLSLAVAAVALAGRPSAKSLPIRVDGDTATVVQSFPLTLTAPPGYDFYIWSAPDAVKSKTAYDTLTVTAAPKGRHKVTVLGISISYEFDKDGRVVRDEAGNPKKTTVRDEGETVFIVGAADPDPKPDPGPGPDPKPTPGPLAKAWVVVVEETQEAAETRGQWFRGDVASYIKGKGWTYRVADKDARDASGNVPADLAPYFRRAEGKTLPQLYVVDQGGGVRLEAAMPATAEKLLETLRKIGG